MATVGPYYSTEYNTAYILNPSLPGNTRLQGNFYGGALRIRPFTYVQAGTGTIADLVYLVKVPSNCVVWMPLSLFKFGPWDTSTTLDIGWLAYIDSATGLPVAADPNGLADGLDIDAAGSVFAGTLFGAAASAAQAYIVDYKEFNSTEEVTITVQFNDAAPTDTDTLSGWIAYTME